MGKRQYLLLHFKISTFLKCYVYYSTLMLSGCCLWGWSAACGRVAEKSAGNVSEDMEITIVPIIEI